MCHINSFSRKKVSKPQDLSEEIRRIYHKCEGGIELSVPRITDCNHDP